MGGAADEARCEDSERMGSSSSMSTSRAENSISEKPPTAVKKSVGKSRAKLSASRGGVGEGEEPESVTEPALGHDGAQKARPSRPENVKMGKGPYVSYYRKVSRWVGVIWSRTVCSILFLDDDFCSNKRQDGEYHSFLLRRPVRRQCRVRRDASPRVRPERILSTLVRRACRSAFASF